MILSGRGLPAAESTLLRLQRVGGRIFPPPQEVGKRQGPESSSYFCADVPAS